MINAVCILGTRKNRQSARFAIPSSVKLKKKLPPEADPPLAEKKRKGPQKPEKNHLKYGGRVEKEYESR